MWQIGCFVNWCQAVGKELKGKTFVGGCLIAVLQLSSAQLLSSVTGQQNQQLPSSATNLAISTYSSLLRTVKRWVITFMTMSQSAVTGLFKK